MSSKEHKSDSDSQRSTHQDQRISSSKNGQREISHIQQRAQIDPDSLTPGTVLQLQSTIGNRSIISLLKQTSDTTRHIRRESDLALGPFIKSLLTPKPTKAEKVIKFLGKWGRNAGPVSILNTYIRLNWPGIKFWMKVSAAAKKGNALLKYVDDLEETATKLKQAIDMMAEAESDLPSSPLETGDKAGQATVTEAEMQYVEIYYKTAASIANAALDALATLRTAISGWDGVLKQAHNTNNFSRAATWNAITLLEIKFSNQGGSFKAALEEMQTQATHIEHWARQKQYHAADILGKWTPDGYAPPG